MAPVPTALPSLTIVKNFSYREAPEEWSNTFFFNGTIPATPASWKHLADLVIAAEKTCWDSNVTAVRAIGHKAGDSVAVWSYDYLAVSEEVPGTFAPGAGGHQCPGDAAAWVRWSTDQLTSKGKPIYLRSYFHNVYSEQTGTDWDKVLAGQKTAYQAYGDAWIAGFDDADGVTHHRAGPRGASGLVALAGEYVTTRTLERRGRRP